MLYEKKETRREGVRTIGPASPWPVNRGIPLPFVGSLHVNLTWWQHPTHQGGSSLRSSRSCRAGGGMQWVMLAGPPPVPARCVSRRYKGLPLSGDRWKPLRQGRVVTSCLARRSTCVEPAPCCKRRQDKGLALRGETPTDPRGRGLDGSRNQWYGLARHAPPTC